MDPLRQEPAKKQREPATRHGDVSNVKYCDITTRWKSRKKLKNTGNYIRRLPNGRGSGAMGSTNLEGPPCVWFGVAGLLPVLEEHYAFEKRRPAARTPKLFASLAAGLGYTISLAKLPSRHL